MYNVLLLGGNGFIGKNLIERFHEEGYTIFLLNRKQDFLDQKFVAENKIKVITGELKDTSIILKTITRYDIDIVIHLVSTLIPSSTYREYKLDLSQVIIPSYRLIDNLGTAKVKFIFFSSGGTIYGKSHSKVNENHVLEPINYYGYSKLMIEEHIRLVNRMYGLNYLILRPSNVYGKYQRLYSQQGFIAVSLGRILSYKPIEIYGDGTAIRDYIFVDDLTDAITKIIKSNIINEVLNIGSGKGTNLLQVVENLQNHFERNIDIVFKDRRVVDLNKIVLNIEKLSSIIPFNPIGIELGIQKFLEQFKSAKFEK
jgi:UDP-glucose 4-epimerase